MFQYKKKLYFKGGEFVETLMTVQHLCKTFLLGETEIQALRDVSFDIYQGEFVVILGPSGSGKSTMLNIIGGLESATSGEVYYQKIPLHKSNRKQLTMYRRNHIGFVFQFYNLIPNLTVLENIAIVSEMSTQPLDPLHTLEQVGLADKANHYPGKLSGGQQQRVAIARAICKNPDFLLCDEPTGALDTQTGMQVLTLLRDFNRTYNKTVVIITHNTSIAQIADRIFYFRDGSIQDIVSNPHPLAPEEVEW